MTATGNIRHLAVRAFPVFSIQAGVLFVGGELLVSFMGTFGTTPSQPGIALGGGWVTGVIGSLTGGHLSDTPGPRQMVLLSTELVILGLPDQALARNWLQAGVALLTVMGAQAALFPAVTALPGLMLGEEPGSALGSLNIAFPRLGENNTTAGRGTYAAFNPRHPDHQSLLLLRMR